MDQQATIVDDPQLTVCRHAMVADVDGHVWCEAKCDFRVLVRLAGAPGHRAKRIAAEHEQRRVVPQPQPLHDVRIGEGCQMIA